MKIKRCCKTKPDVIINKKLHNNFMEKEFFDNGTIKYSVECPLCHKKTELKDSSDEAIKAWNEIAGKRVA